MGCENGVALLNDSSNLGYMNLSFPFDDSGHNQHESFLLRFLQYLMEFKEEYARQHFKISVRRTKVHSDFECWRMPKVSSYCF